MSGGWATAAIEQAHKAATREIPEGPAREAAVEGLRELLPASAAIERLGKAKLRAMTTLLIAGDVPGARAVSLGQGKQRTADDVRAHTEATAEEVDRLAAQARQSMEDTAAILDAIASAGLKAITLALPYVVAAAGL